MKSIKDYIEIVESDRLARAEAAIVEAAQAAASGPTPQAAKALAKADTTQKQWVNGERYVYSDTEAGPQWVLDYSTVPGRQVGSTGLSGIFTKGTTQSRASNAYTGADSGAAAAGNVGAKVVNGKAVPPTGQGAQPTKPAATPDPKVLKIQQDLIAQGAQIKADGIMGPKTQAAMKAYATDPASMKAKGFVQNPDGTFAYGPGDAQVQPQPQQAAQPAAAPAAPPAAPPAVPQNGQMAADTVYTGQNPGIDAATRAAAQKSVAQPAAQPTAAPAQTGKPAQPYYTQDPSTMKVYKEDQALARIVELSRK